MAERERDHVPIYGYIACLYRSVGEASPVVKNGGGLHRWFMVYTRLSSCLHETHRAVVGSCTTELTPNWLRNTTEESPWVNAVFGLEIVARNAKLPPPTNRNVIFWILGFSIVR